MMIVIIVNVIATDILITIIMPIQLTIYKILNIDNIAVVIYYDWRLKFKKSFPKVFVKVNKTNFSLKTLWNAF